MVYQYVPAKEDVKKIAQRPVVRGLLVRDAHDPAVVTVREETALKEVYLLMWRYGIHEFPVVDKDYLLKGVVRQQDLLQAIYPSYGDLGFGFLDSSDLETSAFGAREKVVAEIMCKNVPTVAPGDSLMKAGAKLLAGNHAQAYTIEEGKVIGVLSQGRVFLELMGRYISEDIRTAQHGDLTSEERKKVAYDGSENRMHPRMSVSRNAIFSTMDSDGKMVGVAMSGFGEIADLSLGGLSIEVREGLKLGWLVDIAFSMRNQVEAFRRMGRVVRCAYDADHDVYRVGVMFLAITSAEREQMEILG